MQSPQHKYEYDWNDHTAQPYFQDQVLTRPVWVPIGDNKSRKTVLTSQHGCETYVANQFAMKHCPNIIVRMTIAASLSICDVETRLDPLRTLHWYQVTRPAPDVPDSSQL